MKLKLNINIKKTINIIITILLITLVIVILNQHIKLNEANDKFSTDIKTQEDIISELTQDNEDLTNNIIRLEDINNKSQENNKLLELKVQELLIEIEELEEKISQLNKNIVMFSTDFKSYMPYNSITIKTSKQWELQQQATTNEDGIRCIDGIPMVAVGTGWGLKVGDIAIVTCENGNSFKVMIGDIKSDVHTDAENKTTIANGCRCEFIVEVDKLDSKVRVLGNIATLSKYSGYVVNIEKIS